MTHDASTLANHPLTRRSALSLAAGGSLALALAGCGAKTSDDSVPSDAEPAPVEDGGEATQAEVPALERPMLLATLAKVDDAPRTADYPDTSSSFESVTNLDDWYLSDEMRDLLSRNLFAVDQSGASEFYEVYEENRYQNRASFVTVDSMMHTYHLYFSYLMKGIERSWLSDSVDQMGRLLLETTQAQLDEVAGTEWEDAALRNLAFFAVGVSLFDESYSAPDDVADVVGHELDAIRAAEGIETSMVTGQFMDYSQFAPRGYYEGDEALERYFRAMMWYGQVNLAQADEDLDRSAALMTAALQGEALDKWQAVYAITSFFAGASDDNGYYEYQPLVADAWGEGATAATMAADAEGFARFHTLTEATKPPRINSIPCFDDGEDEDNEEGTKGFRLMGQRFSLDAAVMQQLVYRNVGENSSGEKRMLPDALDVPAAMGSDEAYDILDSRGATEFANYKEHMDHLRDGIGEADDVLWQASLYSQWLHTLNPLLEEHDESYPPFMRSQEWTRKDLQSYLGSYAELKHDTVLYVKQVMAEMGGDLIPERDDRGYVEPEPMVFGRLAALCGATADGLDSYGMLGDTDAENLSLLGELSTSLATIAAKELSGELPSDEEFELIRSYGGQLEHFWQEVYKDEANDEYFTTREFPAAVVTDIATDPNGSCLQLGVGRAADLYVVVPIDGEAHLTSGSVFTFYQFAWPMSDRLTDSRWREMVGSSWGGDGTIAEGIALEDWTSSFTASYDY